LQEGRGEKGRRKKGEERRGEVGKAELIPTWPKVIPQYKPTFHHLSVYVSYYSTLH